MALPSRTNKFNSVGRIHHGPKRCPGSPPQESAPGTRKIAPQGALELIVYGPRLYVLACAYPGTNTSV